MTSADTRTVYERLADAAKEISEYDFKKDAKVQIVGGKGYDYIPIGQILEAVRKAHGRHGIVTFFGPVEFDHDNHESRRTEDSYVRANGHMTVTIVGRMGDSIEMTVPCEAKDKADKLTNLLLTNAERCLYRAMYAIDEGSGADSDPEAFNYPNDEPMPREVPKDDPFFSKPEPKPAEKPAEKPAKEERKYPKQEVLTEASVKQTPAKPAKSAAEKKQADDAREWLAEYRLEEDEDPVYVDYERRFGVDLTLWPDSRVLDCVEAIREAGA